MTTGRKIHLFLNHKTHEAHEEKGTNRIAAGGRSYKSPDFTRSQYKPLEGSFRFRFRYLLYPGSSMVEQLLPDPQLLEVQEGPAA